MGSSNFADVLKSSAFTDKSLLIKELFRRRFVRITAPRRFGKTTNIDMLKKFLEIEVDEATGMPKTRADYRVEAVTDTENYHLFVNNGLRITKNSRIMEERFGRHPVLHVDFKCEVSIQNFEDAYNFLRNVIHRTYKKHCYILRNVNFKDNRRSILEKWCDENEYMNFERNDMTEALKILAECLHAYFNRRKVYVLVDEYDSLINNVIISVRNEEELSKIIKLNFDILFSVLKKSHRVDRALLTGVTCIVPLTVYGINNVESYKFLQKHRFVNFYGLTKDEVDRLFAKPEFHLNQSITTAAHRTYQGYLTRNGLSIYSIYSILRFLQTGEINYYWAKSGIFQNDVENVFKAFPKVNQKLQILLQGKLVHIINNEVLTIDDIIRLRNILLKNAPNDFHDIDLFFSFILEQGFLTTVPQEEVSSWIAVKIPNEEIKKEFDHILYISNNN